MIKFLISVLNWPINFCSNFTSFFIVMTHKSLVNFELIHFLLWIKGSIKSPNFQTCFGKNLPNSSCHFWKHKSFFLQILHQYSMLSKITPMYVFSSNMLSFGQKQLIKVQIFKVLNADENLPKSSCHFPNRKEVFLQILHYSSVSWKITPQYFFRSKII